MFGWLKNLNLTKLFVGWFKYFITPFRRLDHLYPPWNEWICKISFISKSYNGIIIHHWRFKSDNHKMTCTHKISYFLRRIKTVWWIKEIRFIYIFITLNNAIISDSVITPHRLVFSNWRQFIWLSVTLHTDVIN